MRKPSRWKHKKRKQVYNGHYQTVRGERSFVLISEDGKTDYVCESHEAAKELGWKKLS